MKAARAATLAAAMLAGAAAQVSSATIPLNVASVAGVYRDRFEDGDAQGRFYVAENRLEVVRRSSRQAYINLRLVFLNGNSCSASGIADVRGRSLVYDSHKLRDGSHCVLTLNVSGSHIVLRDRGARCREELCTTGGNFSGTEFRRSVRDPIRDRERVLSSPEYSGAVEEYRAAHPH